MNKSRFMSRLTVRLMLVALAGCGGGGGGGGSNNLPPDTIAPITAASPGGGTYGSVRSVTLTSNESATIYYSLDGVDPNVGAPNTISGPSPISGIQMSAGTQVLKFFGIDGAGNRESVKAQTYVIDLVSPNISLTTPAPDPIGLLANGTVNWQSNEAGSYIVELGGNGTIGSGTQLTAGTVAANTPVSQTVAGTRLSYSGATPLWIYVTDGVGHIGSTSVSLNLKPRVPINVGGELRQVAVLPGGLKTYVARTDANAVAVIDTDPASPTFNTVLTNVPVGIRPHGIAATPDGSRVYVTNQSSNSITVIDTSTNTVIATIVGAGSAPNGIAITRDGTRAYFLHFGEAISVLDINPASPSYHTVTKSIRRILLLAGAIAITPDGARAIVNWQGSIAHGVDVLDVNPASASFNTIVSSPVPVVQGLGGDVAVTSDSGFAYATEIGNLLCRINLETSAIAPTGPAAGQSSFALTPDGTTLLMGNPNSNNLRIVKASDLTVTVDVPMGAGLGFSGGIAITPDGARAYVNTFSVNSQVVMVPLQ
jgi:YVTN family beta-propeller protein